MALQLGKTRVNLSEFFQSLREAPVAGNTLSIREKK